MPYFEVSGPAGWVGDELWSVEFLRFDTLLLIAEAPPVSGEYLFKDVIDGVTYTDSFVMDAEQVLAQPDGITVVASSLSALSLTWNVLEGAFEYWVEVHHGGGLVPSGFEITRTNSITFDGLELEADVEYTVLITAFGEIPPPSPELFGVQVNASEARSDPFQVSDIE